MSLTRLLVLLLAGGLTVAAEPDVVVPLWPVEVAPGDPSPQPWGEERDTTPANGDLVAGRRVIRLGNITRPTLSVYRPRPGVPALVKDTAVLVFPGGGYHILAWDLEGTEVCEWLNAQGITAGLVKYRVPQRPGQPAHTAALADAQQALGRMREHAQEWGYAPDRIGALGFSAGGHLCAALAATGTNAATRLNFNILIYPAYLTEKDNPGKLTPAVTLSSNTPPTFLVMAGDDPVRPENVVYYYLAMHQAKLPVELHLYPEGGHGYGLRRTANNVTTWPDRTSEWLQRTLR